MNTTAITFRAAAARFKRKSKYRSRIYVLSARERNSMGSGPYGLLENNTVRDLGDIEAVERWCREAGVLRHNETVAER